MMSTCATYFGSACRRLWPLLAAALVTLSSCKSIRLAQNQHSSSPARTTAQKSKKKPAKPAATPKASGDAALLLDEARKWIGTPYVWGGHGRGTGTDCSGFTMEVFNAATHTLIPRTAAAQCQASEKISRSKARPGDLLFFNTGKGNTSQRITHVGIYMGDDKMIHASSSRGVIIADLNLPYWQRALVQVGRLLPDPGETPAQALERQRRLQQAIDDEINALLDGELEQVES